MIIPADLLSDLQRLLKHLESDIRGRCESNTEIDGRLRAEYSKAKSVNRTAQAYEVWRDEYITQAAVAWILACVFIRFLEDNHLIEPSRLSGVGNRLQLARDQHTVYFQRNPSHTNREYLEHVFREVAKLPPMQDLLNGSHNPISKLGPTGDGATELLEFWQKLDPTTGNLLHDFTDSEWKTRFLGDLYQDLSETARKRYALLQTPEFVEEFILDRTLMPAIEEFGLVKVRMIDPTCGSAHFLLGGFNRLYTLHLKREPGTNVRALVQKALDGLYGVDLNPNVIAIARFRLLLAALKASGIARLKDSPAFRLNFAVGDALLHGPRLGGELERAAYLGGLDPLLHVYETEDADELRRILGQQYHAVVGNPPYITVTDSALNAEYRKRFGSCYRQYSLSVPFTERFFNLALKPGGYVGMITTNSFMKREFGKKLIEEYLPRWDLTHIVDTSRAHIPGHGTPTVILFGRNQQPVLDTIRAVMGIRGETKTPINPSEGLVWRAIVNQIDSPGSESDYVSVADRLRTDFRKHPWSIGGGGAAELRSVIESQSAATIEHSCTEIGFGVVTREDDVFLISGAVARRHGIPERFIRPLVKGEDIRDWAIRDVVEAIWPYEDHQLTATAEPSVLRFLYPWRTQLERRVAYGMTQKQRGLRWFEYSMFFRDRFRIPFSIAFSFVATHNNFVFDRGGKVFKQSAPLMKLPEGATEDQHIALISVLNSSTGCFWMKQTFHNKGGGGIGGGLATEEWEQFYEFDSTKIRQFPIPTQMPSSLGRTLDSLAEELNGYLPSSLTRNGTPTKSLLEAARSRATVLSAQMIGLQEELDWKCYRHYGLVDDDLTVADGLPPTIQFGERAFEIALARKLADGDLETTWFQRHGSTPITEIPSHWPDEYRALVERRIEIIESDTNIGIIEQPKYKRRWNVQSWEEQERRALQAWLLNRLEGPHYWNSLELSTCAKLADCARTDLEFLQVAELFRGRVDFDLTTLVIELVESESVPLLPALRYRNSGLRTRAQWEHVWELQRQQDSIDTQGPTDCLGPGGLKIEVAEKRKAEAVGDILPPPRYEVKDFQKQTYWSLRGKLDVPRERFISFPLFERDIDPTPVVAWAGWDHLQQAQAIASYYERVKNQEGWTAERRIPLLAAILELLPWLKQWHNEIHPKYHERMGDFFQQFVADEARMMEITLDKIRAWIPPAQVGKRGSRRRSS